MSKYTLHMNFSVESLNDKMFYEILQNAMILYAAKSNQTMTVDKVVIYEDYVEVKEYKE